MRYVGARAAGAVTDAARKFVGSCIEFTHCPRILALRLPRAGARLFGAVFCGCRGCRVAARRRSDDCRSRTGPVSIPLPVDLACDSGSTLEFSGLCSAAARCFVPTALFMHLSYLDDASAALTASGTFGASREGRVIHMRLHNFIGFASFDWPPALLSDGINELPSVPLAMSAAGVFAAALWLADYCSPAGR